MGARRLPEYSALPARPRCARSRPTASTSTSSTARTPRCPTRRRSGRSRSSRTRARCAGSGSPTATSPRSRRRAAIAEIVAVQNQLSLEYRGPLARARSTGARSATSRSSRGRRSAASAAPRRRRATTRCGRPPRATACRPAGRARLAALARTASSRSGGEPAGDDRRLGAGRRARARRRRAVRDHRGGHHLGWTSSRRASRCAARPSRCCARATAEGLLDEQAFEHEELNCPTGPSCGRAASRSRAASPPARSAGARVLELGCGGLGLPTLAAALAGGRVLATDWSQQALELLHDQRRAQRRRARDRDRRLAAPGAAARRARGTSCSAPTCSTAPATSRRSWSCCRRCW